MGNVSGHITGMSKIHDLRFKLLLLPLYSADLAYSDYYLFPNREN